MGYKQSIFFNIPKTKTMKQQQNLGKKLGRNDMKKVQGGITTTGLWVCPADYYDCYLYRGQCLTYCSRPATCRWYAGCP
jgi:hypothetical protein